MVLAYSTIIFANKSNLRVYRPFQVAQTAWRRRTGRLCQEMEGMVHSWGVVKWNQLRKKKKSFAEFCEEPSVKNVMIAVQLRSSEKG